MKRIELIVLAFFLFQVAYTQQNYLPGYVIFNEDTIQGYIDYREWKGNPDEITFRETMSSTPLNYRPIDIRGFAVHDEKYISAVVKIEKSSTNINELEFDSELKTTIDTVFLQTLVEGEKSLYYYADKRGEDHFYIRRGIEFNLLTYRKYLTKLEGKSGVTEEKIYLGQLSLYLQDCPDIQTKLMSFTIRYGQKSLSDLFLHYYDCIQSKPEFQKKTEKTHFDFGLLAGIKLTSLDFNAIDYLTKADFQSSAGFSGGLFLEVIPPRNQRKWSLNNELVFSSYQTEGRYADYVNENDYTNYHSVFEFSYLKMNNMLRYKYPVGNCFLYLNAGISNGFAIRNENRLTKEIKKYTIEKTDKGQALNEVRKYEQGYLVGLGVKYRNYSLEFRYENGNGMSVSRNLKSATNNLFFLLGYRF